MDSQNLGQKATTGKLKAKKNNNVKAKNLS